MDMGEANSGQTNSGQINSANSGRGPTYRAALAAVIILGVLLAAGLAALAYGFMRQYQIYRAGRTQNVGAPPAVMELEPGARIVSVKTTSNRMIVQLVTPQGGEVEVMDLETGKLLFRVKTPSP